VGGGTNSVSLRTDSRGYDRRQRSRMYGGRDRTTTTNAVEPAHRVSGRLRPAGGRAGHAASRGVRGNGSVVVRSAYL